jgi:hypothetical protein
MLRSARSRLALAAATVAGTAVTSAALGFCPHATAAASANAVLHGSYGFLDSGHFFQELEGGDVGVMRFDGRGHCAGHDITAFSPNQVESAAWQHCSYSVTRDGTGTITVSDLAGMVPGSTSPVTIHFVLVDGGRKALFFIVNEVNGGDAAVFGTMERQ